MALTEKERQVLEELERNLYHSESDVVARMSRKTLNHKAVVSGILLATLGLVLLAVGVLSTLIVLSFLGFAFMFAGVFISLRFAKNQEATSAESAPAFPRGKSAYDDVYGDTASSGPGDDEYNSGPKSFLERLQERWDKRSQ